MSIQNDIRTLLSETGLTQQELARLAGVNQAAFSRFMNRDGRSIAERIAPYVYGEKRPTATPTTAQKAAGNGDA